MFDALLKAAQALLIQPSCPICRASLEGNPAAKTGAELQPCGLCIEGYGFCQTNSSLKAALGVVIQLLPNHHPRPQGALLVPIPS